MTLTMRDFRKLQLSLISSMMPYAKFYNLSEHIAADEVTVLFEGCYFQTMYS